MNQTIVTTKYNITVQRLSRNIINKEFLMGEIILISDAGKNETARILFDSLV